MSLLEKIKQNELTVKGTNVIVGGFKFRDVYYRLTTDEIYLTMKLFIKNKGYGADDKRIGRGLIAPCTNISRSFRALEGMGLLEEYYSHENPRKLIGIAKLTKLGVDFWEEWGVLLHAHLLSWYLSICLGYQIDGAATYDLLHIRKDSGKVPKHRFEKYVKENLCVYAESGVILSPLLEGAFAEIEKLIESGDLLMDSLEYQTIDSYELAG